MVDFGSIMYDYIWMGFVKLVMALYSVGGLQFTIGVLVGIALMMFAGFFKKIAIWAIILFVIASIGVGIIAADIDWRDIKDGHWTGKVDVSKDEYSQAQNQVTQQAWDYGEQVVQQQWDSVTNQTEQWTTVG